MSLYIPHKPRRGMIPIEPTVCRTVTLEIAEKTALVTYWHAPVRLYQGRCHADLSDCWASWVEGDGSDDFPPEGGGGEPTMARLAA